MSKQDEAASSGGRTPSGGFPRVATNRGPGGTMMSFFRTIPVAEATGKLKALYDEDVRL